MRHYIVNKVQHTVFDSEDEVPPNIHYLREWKDCALSDWVLADDVAGFKSGLPRQHGRSNKQISDMMSLIRKNLATIDPSIEV